MANNADNIQVMRPTTDGVAFTADGGTTVPTSASAAIGDGFSSVGYVSEDGLTMTVNREVVKLKEMGNNVAAILDSSHEVDFKFKPLEWNDVVKKEIFGQSNVDASGNVTVNSDDLPERAFVFDMRGRENVLVRICVPRMRLTEQADLVFKASDALAAELTYSALPDASGNKVYIYCGTASE